MFIVLSQVYLHDSRPGRYDYQRNPKPETDRVPRGDAVDGGVQQLALHINGGVAVPFVRRGSRGWRVTK